MGTHSYLQIHLYCAINQSSSIVNGIMILRKTQPTESHASVGSHLEHDTFFLFTTFWENFAFGKFLGNVTLHQNYEF